MVELFGSLEVLLEEDDVMLSVSDVRSDGAFGSMVVRSMF